MIGTLDVRCNAAKPNFPLQPMFAFQGSPSSIRVLDVPKIIGSWEITSVRVAVLYPNNLTIEKVAVRTGSVWVATFEGCDVAGKVGNGLSIIADGIDEEGNEVSGYVLGKGDVFILENDSDVKRLLEKYTVRYLDEVPAAPSVGDLLNINGQVRLFDGERWLYISNGGEPTVVNDSEIKIKENGTEVGSFTTNSEVPVDIDIPVPSRTSDVVNDSGFITASAIPSKVSSFENDVGYITASAIPSNVSEFNNDAGYITSEAIPSKISAFENDVGFITASALPTNVSELENDAGYITANALPTKVSELQNDAGYITASQVPPVPSNLSDYNNDVGFITASAIPSNVSAFENDAGYLVASSSELENKRDYYDISYNKYDNSDSTYKGIESWSIQGLKVGS